LKNYTKAAGHAAAENIFAGFPDLMKSVLGVLVSLLDDKIASCIAA
jgi:hypothetical protein